MVRGVARIAAILGWLIGAIGAITTVLVSANLDTFLLRMAICVGVVLVSAVIWIVVDLENIIAPVHRVARARRVLIK